MSRASRKRFIKRMIILFIVIVILVCAYVVYFFYKKNNMVVTASSSNVIENNLQQAEVDEESIKDNILKASQKEEMTELTKGIGNIGVTFLNDSDITYNELGEILVIMYHGITPKEVKDDKYHRSVQGFKDDLITLYNNNYRLITIEEYINNSFNLEAGMTPVLLTFDDGLSSSFSLEYKNGELVPKEDTAVDLLNNFYEIHNDFGKSAVFFINSKYEPFAGEGTLEERFTYLIENGYYVGNHSYSHSDMSSLSKDEILKEVGHSHNYVLENLKDYNMNLFAYPYGAIPTNYELSEVLENEYNGNKYEYEYAFLAFLLDDFSSNPLSLQFHNLMIPRFRGTDNETFDLGYFLRYYEENPQRRYFSDGNSEIVTVPFEMYDKLDFEKVVKENKDILVIGGEN